MVVFTAPAPRSTTSWDDFRVVQAVAQCRTMAAAAAVLGVNTSTVFRRVNAIEAAFGTSLFERGRQGYSLTSAGKEMVALAEAMDERILGFERRLAARDTRPSGRLCVTIPESLSLCVVNHVLTGFVEAHPDVELEVLAANAVHDLAGRDVDVAIRVTNAPPEALVGRRVASVGVAVYAPKAVGGQDAATVLGRRWVGLCGGIASAPSGAAVMALMEGVDVAVRFNSYVAIAKAIAEGIGPGPLPCWLGDTTPDLVRLPGTWFDVGAGLWLLTHAELRQVPRVRAFMDYAWQGFSALRCVIEGQDPVSPPDSPAPPADPAGQLRSTGPSDPP